MFKDENDCLCSIACNPPHISHPPTSPTEAGGSLLQLLSPGSVLDFYFCVCLQGCKGWAVYRFLFFSRAADTAMLLHFEWAISAYGSSALLASLSISSSPKPTARLDVYQTQQIKGGAEICAKIKKTWSLLSATHKVLCHQEGKFKAVFAFVDVLFVCPWIFSFWGISPVFCVNNLQSNALKRVKIKENFHFFQRFN